MLIERIRYLLAAGCSAVMLLVACSAVAVTTWEVRGPGLDRTQIWSAAASGNRIFAFGNPGGVGTRAWEFVPGATPADDTWEPRAWKPGLLIAYFTAVTMPDGDIYIAGGGLAGSASHDELAIYDPDTDSWSLGPSLPQPVNNYAAAAVDGSLVVAGGCCGNRTAVQVYTPGSGWRVATVTLSEARIALGGTSTDEGLFVTGGYIWPNGSATRRTTEIVDPVAETRQLLAAMPTPRESVTCVRVGRTVYAIAGWNSGPLATVETFDLDSRAWSGSPTVPQLPVATWGHAVVARGAIWVLPFDLQSGAVQRLVLKPVLASAGPDAPVDEGSSTPLAGSAVAPEGCAIAYEWTQVAGPAVTLSDWHSPTPTLTAPLVASNATVTLRLVATACGMASEPDEVNITIVNVNRAPIADAGDDFSTDEDSPVRLSGISSYDPDGDTLTSCTWTQVVGPTVMLVDVAPCEVEFAAPDVGASTQLVFELVVSDGRLDSSADSVVVTVEPVNHAPTCAVVPVAQTTLEVSLVTLSAVASMDPDGDELAFSWAQVEGPPVSLLDPFATTTSFVAPTVSEATLLSFRLTATDGSLQCEPILATVTVLNANDPADCSLATASVALLWPPNHGLREVGIVGVSDPDDDRVTVSITSVTSDEPANGLGDGDTTPDAARVAGSVLLRAERSGLGDGRVYHVHFTADDGVPGGGTCTGMVTAAVPHSRGSLAVDGGELHVVLAD